MHCDLIYGNFALDVGMGFGSNQLNNINVRHC